MLAGKYFDISNSTGSFFYSVLMVNYTVLPEVGYFSMKYFILSKVYTDEGGVNSYTKVCPPVREIIASLTLLVQADEPWYDYYKYPRTDFMLPYAPFRGYGYVPLRFGGR